MARSQIIVAGGGPAGLAAAFRLQQAGHAVQVLEQSLRAGSKMCSRRRDGFLLDKGAIFLPTTHRNLLGIAADAGLSDQLVPGGFVFGLVRDGKVHRLDGERIVRDFVRTQALSPRAKVAAARLVPEVLRARKATTTRIVEAGEYDGMTLAEWAEGNLSREVSDHLLGPAIRGIFATEPSDVSRVEFLGILALFAGAKLLAFRGGMGAYADGLADQLDVVLGAEVVEVRQTADGAEVTWREEDGEHVRSVDGCVVALPARRAVSVRPDMDQWRRDYLSMVRAGKIITPNIALDAAPAGMDTTYAMVPRSEHPFLGAIGFDHNKAPGRAPAGKGLLTATLTTDWCERHVDDHDDSLSAIAVEAADSFLPGTADAVQFVEITRWEQQYSPVGHYARLGEFRFRSARHDKSVVLAGEYLSAPNLSAATASGEAAAAALDAELRKLAG
ncbi:Renalase [Paraconexibacter sp. AEG42_29]|uniref:Renalase n=1 Tax=Paraconexibacter sp. AEG42_29 TaxID=2997339 RepID=A0AAU7B0F7_9ACTN